MARKTLTDFDILTYRRATYPVYFTHREVDGSRKEACAIRHCAAPPGFPTRTQLSLEQRSYPNLLPKQTTRRLPLYRPRESSRADCNHILINFIYSLPVTHPDALEAVPNFVERRDGKRLRRLHVTGSEIQTVLEDEAANSIPVRWVIENVFISDFILDFTGIGIDKDNPQVDWRGGPLTPSTCSSVVFNRASFWLGYCRYVYT